ncbi:hypothetical protein H0H93_015246 [Arthromyces matolae]|nr:hypothetical protein H0H93_015246 [Arthromyces matolae]
MTTLLNRHTLNGDLAHTTRAAQRKLRQLEIENEQRLEDAEALKMTEEQRQILHNSFRSVKVEFSDLDGLSWQAKSPKVSSSDQAFVVLTNADLASFGPHDTIRASISSQPSARTSVSSPSLSSRPFYSSSPTLRHTHSTVSLSSQSLSSTNTLKAILRNHRATRSRSPVKGLFPDDAYDSEGERTIRAIDSDQEDSPCTKKERKKARIFRRTGSFRCKGATSPSQMSSRSAVKKFASRASHIPFVKGGSASRNANSPHDTAIVSRAVDIASPTTRYPAYITYSKSAPTDITQSPDLEGPSLGLRP